MVTRITRTEKSNGTFRYEADGEPVLKASKKRYEASVVIRLAEDDDEGVYSNHATEDLARKALTTVRNGFEKNHPGRLISSRVVPITEALAPEDMEMPEDWDTVPAEVPEAVVYTDPDNARANFLHMAQTAGTEDARNFWQAKADAI